MLPPFIIEQIRKREKEEREHQAEQPRLELPLERRRWSEPPKEKEEVDRGVVIVDLGGPARPLRATPPCRTQPPCSFVRFTGVGSVTSVRASK